MANSDPSSILITGATSPIGRSIAQRFARHGWRLGLFDRDADALERLGQKLSAAPQVITQAIDVTDEAAVHDALNVFTEQTGDDLHVLVNAAGVMRSGRFENLDLQAHREQIDGNLWAMLAVTHAAFPLLRDTERARVISIASASSMYGTPDLASYSAAKAGVRSLTQALNLEWAHHDIHVCDVVPPYVDASAEEAEAAGLPSPPRRLAPNLSVDDVTDAVEQAVTENRIHWPVGKQFRWIYRLSDMLPASVVRLLMRYVSGF
ncbi:MAG: short-chain dehydrogenase [Bacteroidetes bacterium SW_9_63_38]|nr:MAG: short-chain dehydrogenase [Bacteroidetes bacterium SW_9_63_38]